MAKTKEPNFGLDTQEMAKLGLHFGHRSDTTHPKMTPYLYGVRNSVHIIDLARTKEKLTEALKFIQQVISAKGTLLVVGTKVQTKGLVREFAKECGLPHITERWLGGTFTNFEAMKKRLNYFKDLEKKKEEGELAKYTKKEQAKIDQELRELKTKFDGVKNLQSLPEAILVLDMKKDQLAVKEAKNKGVKVIGIADTNVDPTLADYPIPANDDAISSVKYILDKIKDAIKQCQKKS